MVRRHSELALVAQPGSRPAAMLADDEPPSESSPPSELRPRLEPAPHAVIRNLPRA